MYRVLNKNDYWHKNISSFERLTFGIVIYLNYLSAIGILITTAYVSHNIGRIKHILLNTGETGDTVYTSSLELLETTWGIAKIFLIFLVIFLIIWTVILKYTKSRIMSTTMLILCCLSFLLSFFTISDSILGFVCSAITLFLYIPFTKSTYTFQKKWNVYQSTLAYDEKARANQKTARIKREFVQEEGFTPFQKEDKKPMDISQNTPSVYAAPTEEKTEEPAPLKSFTTIQPAISAETDVECVPAEPINFDDI